MSADVKPSMLATPAMQRLYVVNDDAMNLAKLPQVHKELLDTLQVCCRSIADSHKIDTCMAGRQLLDGLVELAAKKVFKVRNQG